MKNPEILKNKGNISLLKYSNDKGEIYYSVDLANKSTGMTLYFDKDYEKVLNFYKEQIQNAEVKMNQYRGMKERHQKEFNKFPIKFAFSDEQFKTAMNELGLKETDTDKIVSTVGGGFMKKEDAKKYKDMVNRQYEEFQNAIKEDKTGEGFIKDMFEDEMANHEYGYTMELDDTLNALGLTYKDIEENDNLLNGLNLAKQKYFKEKTNESEEKLTLKNIYENMMNGKYDTDMIELCGSDVEINGATWIVSKITEEGLEHYKEILNLPVIDVKENDGEVYVSLKIGTEEIADKVEEFLNDTAGYIDEKVFDKYFDISIEPKKLDVEDEEEEEI